MFSEDGTFDEFFTDSIDSEPLLAKDEPLPQQEPKVKKKKEKPTHYKVISISLYMQDLEHLDALVKAAKGRGLTRMSRSQLIREALRQIDLSEIPPQR